MALKGFLHIDNYSVVKIRTYDKAKRILQVTVTTYQDSTKQKELTEMNYNWFADTHDICISKDLMSMPEVLPIGDKYLVGEGASAPLNDLGGMILYGIDVGKWGIKTPINGNMVYIQEDDQWLEWYNGGWQASITGLTPDEWDLRFGVAAIEAAGNNEVKAAYDYLKTLPEWQNATSN